MEKFKKNVNSQFIALACMRVLWVLTFLGKSSIIISTMV